MALYPRYVLLVDAATGDDTRGSGSSATIKDSDALSGTTLVITNNAGGSTVTRLDAAAFADPPVAGVDTLVVTDTVGGLGMFHIAAIDGTNKTLTLVEAPSTGTSIGNPWGIGGAFASIARAALLAKPSNANGGADDHVYVKAGSGYSGTVKVTFSNAGTRSRPIVFEGYTTTPGDGGQATYDITATATQSFNPNANDQSFRNFKLTNSGNVGSALVFEVTAGRGLVDNIWASTAGAGAVGIDPNPSVVFRCRANCTATAGIGIRASATTTAVAFSIAHDCGSGGIITIPQSGVFVIADTCGTGTATGGFQKASGTGLSLFFCTAYNQGTAGSGVLVADATSCIGHSVIGAILANNAAYGISRAGVVNSLPFYHEAYNDLFGNGVTPRLNGEDMTSYDATPTDKALDPQFADAPNQNFAIGTNLKGLATVALPVGGTTVLDMGAAQRDEIGGVLSRAIARGWA